jgi:hypothetical protein
MSDTSSPPKSTEERELKSRQEALETVQAKMRKLVDDFAKGVINRTQFHRLYDRFQRQTTQIVQLNPEPVDPTEAAGEDGESTFLIKKKLTAKVLGVSIYNNQSGMPLDTIGEFVIDPALLVPMLSSYRAATREIFKAGMRSTAMENDQWLCFVPGNMTTLIALFSFEPSAVQLGAIERAHRDFEDANKTALEKGSIDPSNLAYPFLTFVKQAHNQMHSDKE